MLPVQSTHLSNQISPEGQLSHHHSFRHLSRYEGSHVDPSRRRRLALADSISRSDVVPLSGALLNAPLIDFSKTALVSSDGLDKQRIRIPHPSFGGMVGRRVMFGILL